MNILLFCLFLSALYSDEPKDLLAVDIRQRIMNDKQIRIVIQINNNSQRNISELDGFLLRINSKGDILSEKRITFLEPADGALQAKQSISKDKVFPLNLRQPDRFEFYIAKVRFPNDYRVYTYHPAIGFYRVD
jgi:hypothetical protein